MSNEQDLLSAELAQNFERYPKQVARLFHGRGRFFKGLESLVIEWYPPVLLLQCYDDCLSDTALAGVQAFFKAQPAIETVVLQTRPWPDFSSEILFSRAAEGGQLPMEFDCPLNPELQCQISLGKNRNTGAFPDMRGGWYWLRDQAANKRVLNLFSYTAIFSLYALQGGANKVVNIDMCGSATKTAKYNHELNGLLDERVSIWKKNILKSNSQIAKQSKFDIVVLDPPPFHKGSFKGWPDYQKLLRRCASYTRVGGTILAALNHQQLTFFEFERDIRATLDDVSAITKLSLSDEIKELEQDKGLKLALIRL
ncbi:MAG: class I SAM-dependent methyltransferase [Cellvibrionaceae bacterium]|nr:class I SAM-dependent methyltransferase [Cellvibrionaceae bacterium]MCV6627328.1 class I SAM-dependent methyltransferase [Cellvibrionaceae bacterium]